MRRAGRINQEWETPTGDHTFTWEHVAVEVLMDIRAQLQRLNSLLHCGNFTGMPATLRAIRRNTTKKRKGKK